MATFVSIVNTGDTLFTAISEPLIGKLLDSHWTGVTKNGVHVHSLHDYTIALFTLLLYLLFAMICLYFVKKYS